MCTVQYGKPKVRVIVLRQIILFLSFSKLIIFT